MKLRPTIIGIAGPSGAGKTVLANRILSVAGPKRVVILQSDSYYKDRSGMSRWHREKINYDHPDALDVLEMVTALKHLKYGKPIRVPIYDYSTHCRKKQKMLIEPSDVIIVEGILVLAIPSIRKLLDVKMYVNSEKDIAFIRRLQRDMVQRKRSIQSVISQYMNMVKPMYEQFIEPSRVYADITISDVMNPKVIEFICAYCKAKERK